MKKTTINSLFLTTFIIVATAFGACSSSSSTPPDSEDTVTTGNTELSNRDLTSAESTFCDELDGGSTDSQVAFGCFLSQALVLPESTDATALLTAMGQSSIDVETDILTDVVDDFMGDSSHDSEGFNEFSYLSYSHLPFVDVLSGDFTLDSKFARITNFLVESETTHDEFKTLILNLRDEFEYMSDALDTVLADTSFSYSMPADLFSTDGIVTISYNDARLFSASIKLTVVTLNILDAYNFGVEPSGVVNSDETSFDYEVLTADLNGAAGSVNGVTVDGTGFLTLEDVTLITDSEETFSIALSLASEGLNNLNDGESSDVLDPSINGVSLSNTVSIIDDIKTSYDDNTLTALSAIDDREISVNLKEFFTNPPSSSDITDTDAFVYNSSDDKIEIVESYFNEFLSNIATF